MGTFPTLKNPPSRRLKSTRRRRRVRRKRSPTSCGRNQTSKTTASIQSEDAFGFRCEEPARNRLFGCGTRLNLGRLVGDLVGITQNKLAVSIDVSRRRINEIVHGKWGITADTAIRLARYFGTSDEFWMNLQSNYELRLERRATLHKSGSSFGPRAPAVALGLGAQSFCFEATTSRATRRAGRSPYDRGSHCVSQGRREALPRRGPVTPLGAVLGGADGKHRAGESLGEAVDGEFALDLAQRRCRA